MAEHRRTSQKQPEDVDQGHGLIRRNSQALSDRFHAWDRGTLTITETSFQPEMGQHAALLKAAHSDEGRANFALHLQQTYGNRYVQRLLESMKVQSKLTVNPPNDVYEQEADRVARAVTRDLLPKIQRQQEEEELETKSLLQLEDMPSKEDEGTEIKPMSSTRHQVIHMEELQTQPVDSQPAAVSEDLESRINKARGSGQPLSDTVREPMEQAFGADFSDIRLHTDSAAHVLNQRLSARAFTIGRDIFFRHDEYSPGSDSGRELLAHELTHAVQQGAVGIQHKRVSSGLEATAPESQVLRYLESAGRGPGDDEMVFRKEIEEFQQQHSQGGIATLQLHLLDGQTVDIATPDRSQTLRRKGKSKTPSTTPPKLTKETLLGPTTEDCGGYSWTIQWKLDKASPKGGWIVQKIEVESDIKKKDDTKIEDGFQKWVPYWEAWRVMPGKNITVYADGTEASDCQDDTFACSSFGADSKGELAENGTAEFYEGLTLPSSLKANPKSPAGELRMTQADPGLAGGSGSIAHNLTAKWDGTKDDKSTKVTTV